LGGDKQLRHTALKGLLPGLREQTPTYFLFNLFIYPLKIHSISQNSGMVRLRKAEKGCGSVLLEILPWYLPQGTEKNDNSICQCSLFQPRFKLDTSQIQVRIIAS
jgi:hypothetical protein